MYVGHPLKLSSRSPSLAPPGELCRRVSTPKFYYLIIYLNAIRRLWKAREGHFCSTSNDSDQLIKSTSLTVACAKHVFSTLKIEKCSGNKNPRYFCLLDYPTVTHINLTELIDQLIPKSIYTVRRLKEVFYGGLVCTELGFSFRSVLQQAE